jgi:creatinine amidohydrolase
MRVRGRIRLLPCCHGVFRVVDFDQEPDDGSQVRIYSRGRPDRSLMEEPVNSPRPYVLAETNWQVVSQTTYDIAVLPWGATEAHNFHLPYACDTIQAEHVAIEAARIAWEGGAHVAVLPAIPFGVQTGQLDIPLCINVNPSTQAALLDDIAHSLAGQGIHKLVVLNGHGGNEFKAMIREVQPRHDILICLLNWYMSVDARKVFDEPGDHAGELETSMLLHLTPHLVLPLDQAGTGAARPFRVQALRDGWAWTPRQWRKTSEDTGVGNPARSTSDKGATFFGAATQRIADFLLELARTGELYE